MNSKAIKRQLLAAIAMVLVAAIALGSSTYAWFAANGSVTADGLKATAQSGASALLIANNIEGVTDKNFSTAVKLDTDATALAPASTVNGKDFFWTEAKNVTADGDAYTDTYIPYDTDNKSKFPTGAVPYIEYDLLLKASLSEAASIDLTKLDLKYDHKTGSETDNENAFRVAFFVSQPVGNVTTASAEPVNLVSIMSSQHGSTNFTSGEAVVSATGTGAVLKTGQAARVAASVEANKDVYYHVIVRLWIEGEDITCTNTVFNPLKGEWECSLEFTLGSTSVTNFEATGHQPDSKTV